jgi:hypothetical protein
VEGEVFFRRDGTSFPVEYWLRPMLRSGELQGAVCTFLDVSERRHAQEQQALLLRELDHRMKNLFAVTAGVVALSARSALSPQDMAKTVRGRLDALPRALPWCCMNWPPTPQNMERYQPTRAMSAFPGASLRAS